MTGKTVVDRDISLRNNDKDPQKVLQWIATD